MNTLSKPAMGLAAALSALAGYVDVLGFLQLRGTFISFMSGNSTQLAVALAGGEWAAVKGLASVIGTFLFGVFLGTLLRRLAPSTIRTFSVLIAVTALIFAGAICAALKAPFLAIACLVLAMGVENAVFMRAGDVVVGLTYMTGTLVKLSQKLADAVTGGPLWGWVPWACLWTGLVSGGIAGAFGFAHLGLNAIYPAAVWITGVTAYAWAIRARLDGASDATDV
jgi:uncharacterized membrane protein YoaK (UPF0700 family)